MGTDDRTRSPSDRPPPQPPGGQYVERLCDQAGISGRELARRMGRSQGYISDITRGHKGPSEGYRPVRPTIQILNEIANAVRAAPAQRRRLLELWGYAPGPETALAAEAARRRGCAPAGKGAGTGTGTGDTGTGIVIDVATFMLGDREAGVVSVEELERIVAKLREQGVKIRLRRPDGTIAGRPDINPGRSPGEQECSAAASDEDDGSQDRP